MIDQTSNIWTCGLEGGSQFGFDNKERKGERGERSRAWAPHPSVCFCTNNPTRQYRTAGSKPLAVDWSSTFTFATCIGAFVGSGRFDYPLSKIANMWKRLCTFALLIYVAPVCEKIGNIVGKCLVPMPACADKRLNKRIACSVFIFSWWLLVVINGVGWNVEIVCVVSMWFLLVDKVEIFFLCCCAELYYVGCGKDVLWQGEWIR